MIVSIPRVAIGLFYIMTHGTIKFSAGEFKWNLLFHVYCMLLILSLLGLVTYVEKDEYAFFRFILLLICMDIETNPGPNENENNIVNTLEIYFSFKCQKHVKQIKLHS